MSDLILEEIREIARESRAVKDRGQWDHFGFVGASLPPSTQEKGE